MNSVVFNKMELVGAIKQFAPFPHQVLETIEVGVEVGENEILKFAPEFKDRSFVFDNVKPIATKETVNNVSEIFSVITWIVLMIELIASSTIGSLPSETNVHKDPKEGLYVVNSLMDEFGVPRPVVVIIKQYMLAIHDLCAHKRDGTLYADNQYVRSKHQPLVSSHRTLVLL